MKAKTLTVFLSLFLCGGGIVRAAHAGSGTSAGCVDWRSEAVFNGSGYNHLVHLTSRCDASMSCEVSSDLNSTPTKVEVAPGKSQTVNTFLGSPSNTFSPTVKCQRR